MAFQNELAAQSRSLDKLGILTGAFLHNSGPLLLHLSITLFDFETASRPLL